MATISTPNLVLNSSIPLSPSPPLKGIKKVFSGRRRSSEVQSEDGTPARRSLDSLERSPTLPSTRSSPTRDEHRHSIQSGIHKLIPGHNKRQRQRVREAELEAIEQEPISRGRPSESSKLPPPAALDNNRSTSSLLTDGSENDTPPPLVTRNSHTGYFTTSSPLMSSKTLSDGQENNASDVSLPSTLQTEAFPVILEPDERPPGDVSPRSPQLKLDSAPVLPSPNMLDRTDTLQVEQPERRGSISRLRGKSPARKIRDVFSRPSKSPRTSPEREPVDMPKFGGAATPEQANLAERRLADNPSKVPPPALSDPITVPRPTTSPPRKPLSVDTAAMPKTPPSGRLATPLTTVTPPTPTDLSRTEIMASPKVVDDTEQSDSSGTERSTSAPTNSISHRRVRSGSANTHQKSKLSLSMTAPLTPTIEESNKTPGDKPAGARNFTAGSGFFSSWVSAAQNAATSITSLTGQNRSRAGTSNSDQTKAKTTDEIEEKEADTDEVQAAKKKLAVETLGSGNLDFSHLGLDASADDKTPSLSRPDLASSRKKSDLQRDEERAKVEDLLAKRAVSAAYQEPGESTPVAELSDPVANIRPAQTLESSATGTLTPPNGNVLDNDGQAVKRSSSVRSKLGKRRSRGSSVATGQSVVATPGTAILVNPPAPRVTGFTPAPKQRNRAFHQQFRSVPEDDNLIEDYSCALQKEILLAGRIYISEGHICFSSNILGWVTTLIISFEEIVSIERENTAMIIPNAIAIQTLHARHTFRSLLSREATFDLMIGIWKVNHPASFSKSVNGKQLVAEQAQQDAEKALGTKVGDDDEGSEGSTDDGSESGSDQNDDDSAPSLTGSNASIAGSEFLDAKSVTHKPSGTNGIAAPTNGAPATGGNGDIAATAAAVAGVAGGAAADFPGPATHAPTECTDSATHYDKVIKDEIIAAPLGKIYSLLYGPQSGAFLRKYLVDECKSLDLALEDDKKGLTNEAKVRQYSYIKPLGGSIGPKQTKCITTENLDFFDLDKSVSVTCTTQTPDVPSGNAFATKTRYCLSWAPGNATRLQMNCVIEWSAKSWLKGPIEKGANEGQQQYGDGLVKALKAALGRSRGATVGSKGAKGKKKKRGERKTKSEETQQTPRQDQNWGLFEPLRSTLGPVVDIVGPVAKMEFVVAVLSIMMLMMWFGGGRSGSRQLGYLGSSHDRLERLVAYEQLWQREESELWDWLEDRAGVNRVMLGGSASSTMRDSSHRESVKSRQKMLKDKNMAARLQAEKWNRKEMQEAVRVTRERLDEMQRVLDQKVV